MTIFTSYLIYELLFVSWLPAASGCQNVQFALLNKFCWFGFDYIWSDDPHWILLFLKNKEKPVFFDAICPYWLIDCYV